MKKQKIIINKNTGEITTVYSDQVEKILEKISDKKNLTVKRVSNIEFDNQDKNWKAIDVLNGDILVSTDTKKETYSKEAKWADDNLADLSKKHFIEENTTN